MGDLVGSLFGGVAAILLVFFALYRFTRFDAKGAALVVALAVIGVYVPVAILWWPGGDVFAIHIAIYLISAYALGIIFSVREARDGDSRRFHCAPALIILFFAFVVAIDSVFVMLARKGVDSELAEWLLPKPRSGGEVSSHFPGTVARNYQEREAAFNEWLERMEAQRLRNWRIREGWVGGIRAGEPAVFRLELADKDARPIREARIEGRFMRPGNVRLDQAFRMAEVAPGRYEVRVTLPEPGRWNVHVKIGKDDVLHEFNARTTVAEPPA